MARKGFLRVAGVIENMGPTTAPDGTVVATFGSGGGAALAHDIGVPLLGSVPLDPEVSAGGDAGTPVALAAPDSPAGQALAALADLIVHDVAPPVTIADCSLRGALVRAGADLETARRRAEPSD
jgi:ATP-binding protein involved in chromosome partitioning